MNSNLIKLAAYNGIDAKNMTVQQLIEHFEATRSKHFDDQYSMALEEALRKAK